MVKTLKIVFSNGITYESHEGEPRSYCTFPMEMKEAEIERFKSWAESLPEDEAKAAKAPAAGTGMKYLDELATALNVA